MKLLCHYIMLEFNVNGMMNCELETLFQRNQTSIIKDVVLNLPNTNRPMFVTLDTCFIGIGSVSFKMKVKEKNWMKFWLNLVK